MRNIRKAIAGLLLAGLSIGAVQSLASSEDDSHSAKCRWTSRHGIVCDTKISTVNI